MAESVVVYTEGMSRWRPGARERLERAALELFTEAGFAETTVPQITARAGLTTRTFFRHFTDKREVLFAAEQGLPHLVASLMAQAPPDLDAMGVTAWGLDHVATTRFEGLHKHLRARRAVIRGDDGLQERELQKLSVLTRAIDDGFLDRGLNELSAALAARIATAVFDVSLDRWLDQDGGQPLAQLLRESFDTLHPLIGDPTAGQLAPRCHLMDPSSPPAPDVQR